MAHPTSHTRIGRLLVDSTKVPAAEMSKAGVIMAPRTSLAGG